MARTQAAFPGGVRFSDYLGLGVIAQVFPPRSIEAALDACGARSARRRDLPLEAMAYCVIAMGLFRQVSTGARCFAASRTASASSLWTARRWIFRTRSGTGRRSGFRAPPAARPRFRRRGWPCFWRRERGRRSHGGPVRSARSPSIRRRRRCSGIRSRECCSRPTAANSAFPCGRGLRRPEPSCSGACPRTRRPVPRAVGDRECMRRGQDPSARAGSRAAEQDAGPGPPGGRRADARALRRAEPDPPGGRKGPGGSGRDQLRPRRERGPQAPSESGRRFPLIRTLSRRPSMPRSSRSAPCGAGDRPSREECAEK